MKIYKLQPNCCPQSFSGVPVYRAIVYLSGTWLEALPVKFLKLKYLDCLRMYFLALSKVFLQALL